MNLINSENFLNTINTDNWDNYIQNEQSIKSNTISGNNVLHLACMRGKENIIDQIILKYPQFIYLSNNQGENCSHILLKNGWFHIFTKLINKYPDLLYFINSTGNSLFQIFIDQPSIIKYLFALLPTNNMHILNNININGETLLINLIYFYKTKKEYIELIHFVLKNSIDVNFPKKKLPIIYATKLNIPNIVELLLEYNCDPNFKDINGKTPLMISVKKGLLNLTKILIDNGSDINIHDNVLNNFPLNLAIESKNKQMIEIILNNNPNYNFVDKYLNTPLHYCLYSNNEKQWLNNSLIFKFIFHTNLNTKNIKGITCMHLLNVSGQWKNYTELLKIKYINNNIIDYKKRNTLSLIHNQELPIYLQLFKKKDTILDFNINMPKIIKTNYGQFNSDLLHNILYTIIFLKKYKNLMIPYVSNNIVNNLEYNIYKTEIGNLLYSIIDLFKKNFFNISPHLIIWHNKNIYYFDNYLKNSLKILLDNKNIRFIMLKLTILVQNKSTHANVILYDKNTNELFRFEPYGQIDILDYDYLNNIIEVKFKKYIDKNLKYYSPKDFLNETHFQLISDESNPDNKKLGDPEGYCLAYCFWFIELKINNESENIINLIKKSFQTIIKNIDYSNPVLDYIRNYANKLNYLSILLLKEIGIEEKYLYNLSFQEEHINKIINYCQKQFNFIIKIKS